MYVSSRKPVSHVSLTLNTVLMENILRIYLWATSGLSHSNLRSTKYMCKEDRKSDDFRLEKEIAKMTDFGEIFEF